MQPTTLISVATWKPFERAGTISRSPKGRSVTFRVAQRLIGAHNAYPEFVGVCASVATHCGSDAAFGATSNCRSRGDINVATTRNQDSRDGIQMSQAAVLHALLMFLTAESALLTTRTNAAGRIAPCRLGRGLGALLMAPVDGVPAR